MSCPVWLQALAFAVPLKSRRYILACVQHCSPRKVHFKIRSIAVHQTFVLPSSSTGERRNLAFRLVGWRVFGHFFAIRNQIGSVWDILSQHLWNPDPLSYLSEFSLASKENLVYLPTQSGNFPGRNREPSQWHTASHLEHAHTSSWPRWLPSRRNECRALGIGSRCNWNTTPTLCTRLDVETKPRGRTSSLLRCSAHPKQWRRPGTEDRATGRILRRAQSSCQILPTTCPDL